MEQCSICLESLDGGVLALAACGHRFHAACLAQMAGAVGTATTRRGSLTACPNCRTTSRVAPVTSAAFSVGDRVLALWGHKFYPGVVDEVVEGGDAYEIVWDDGDVGRVLAKNVRVAAPARAAPRRPPAVAPTRPAPRRPAVAPAPAAAPDEEPSGQSTAAPTPRRLMRCGNCKACRARRGGERCSAPVPFVPSKKSRFTGVHSHRMSNKWFATIGVRGTRVGLGSFDDEEDAARAYDAAVVKYRDEETVNFPGEAPLASVLAALPELDDATQHRSTTKGEYNAVVAAAASVAAAPRHERALAARRVGPQPVSLRGIGAAGRKGEPSKKACEMRRIGDAAWRWFGSRADAGKAFGLPSSQVSLLVIDPARAMEHARETFEARPARGPPKKRERPTKRKAYELPKSVEGARQKKSGKWVNGDMFPGREFDDFDAYRAAKKQRAARREAWSARARENNYW